MPILSRRFSLWTRLYGRMLLEPTRGPTPLPQVSEVVVPTLNADALLMVPTAQGTTLDLSGGARVIAYTVPADEEWQLIEVTRVSTTAAAGMELTIGGVNVPIAGSTTLQIVLLAGDMAGFILREGDTINALGTGNGGDSSRAVHCVYNKLDLGI